MDQFPRSPFGKGRILHGGDYNPDQWQHAPEVIDEDFRLMKLAGCNTFSVGIFAWTSYEPEEGVYRFDWLDGIMDRMAEAGHHVFLATPSGAKPAWMSKKYPEIRRVDRNGLREPHRDRHNHCWSSPVYREKVAAINRKLAERYANHPALAAWHVSNEYSGFCYCDLCLGRWHRWLEERYGTLEKANLAWWSAFWSHTFTAWDEIDPRDHSLDGMNLDWHRFNTQQVIDFYQWEVAPLRELTPEVPTTTNFMGLFGGLDYSRLAEVVDFVADDQYPMYNPDDPDLVRNAASMSFKDDLYRCFKPDRPWMLIESCPDATQWKPPRKLKRPGVHQAEMLQALGHGASGTCYFQWRAGAGSAEKLHGAVVDHSGSADTRVFRSVAALGSLYEGLAPVLGEVNRAEVAFLFDWDSRWGYEFSGGSGANGGTYDRTIIDHYLPFWERGIGVDVLSSERDFSAYRLVVAPILWMLKPGVAQRIRNFVANGGTFVATFWSGIADEANRCLLGGWPGEGLQEVFGVWNEENDWMESGRGVDILPVPDARLRLSSPLRSRELNGIYHLKGAEVLATYGGEFYEGTPAIMRNEYGRGQAMTIGAELDTESLRSVYRVLENQLGLSRAMAADYPGTVAVQRRGPYCFVQNWSPEPSVVDLGSARYRSMIDDREVTGRWTVPGMGSDVLKQA